MRKQLILVSVSIAAMALSQPALADAPQQAGDTTAAAPSDIIVTAQKRNENIQKVAIAITALSGDTLAEKGVANEHDLQEASPGLTITKAGITDSVNIRGIGLASGSPNVANGVATYIDGLYQPPITQGFDLFDVANIEVLRGPQGTLVGSNSTGGAVVINNKKPELNHLGAMLDLDAGSYNNYKMVAAVNLPIGDDFALRFATDQHSRDSYYTSIGPVTVHPDSLDEHLERLSALYKANGWSIYAKAELLQNDTGGYAYQPIAGTQFGADGTGQRYVLSYDSPTDDFERSSNFALDVKYTTGGGVTFRSLTGYQNKRYWATYDLDGTSTNGPFGPEYQNQYVREREYSQEINILSPASGAFNWVLGGYAQRNKIDVLLHINGTAPFEIVPDIQNDKILLGIFGQGNYKLSDKFEVQAGLRYSHFHIVDSGNVCVGAPTCFAANVPQAGTEGDGAVTGKLALNYKPDSNNLVYVFAARGYKPGGANPPGQVFTHEIVMDYEIGWKSNFLDNHIHTQLGGFYNNYKNFQIDATNPQSGQAGVFNVPGTSTIKGFEASMQARLNGFTFDFGGAYVHSHLPPFPVVNTYVPGEGANLPQCTGNKVFPSCFDYLGNTVDNPNGSPNLLSPEWTWNASLAYKFDLGGDAKLEPRINYSYVGSQFAHITLQPQDYIAAHHLLSANIALTWQEYKLEAYGTNLTKEYYESGTSGTNAFYGAPRELGVRFGFTF